MKRMFIGGVLLLAVSAFAQIPYGSPPHTTPPTFPSDQAPRVPQSDQQPQYPPDVAPAQMPMSASATEDVIRQKLAAEPLLKNAKLDVRVTEHDVTLSGTVDDQRQHEFALQVAQSNAGDRHIVDKIKVRS